jgi:hypothetical protein
LAKIAFACSRCAIRDVTPRAIAAIVEGMKIDAQRRGTGTSVARLPTPAEEFAHFFDPLPSAHHEPRHGEPRHVWSEPPPEVVPADAGLVLVLARTDDAAVIVHELEAWPGGFQLLLRVRTRPGRDVPVDDPIFTYEPYARRRLEHGKVAPPEQFRFGLRLPGGERLTNLSPGAAFHSSLSEAKAKGGKGEWVYRFGLTPLPQPGRMWIVCEWPRLSIAASGVTFDTDVLRAAASRAIRLW